MSNETKPKKDKFDILRSVVVPTLFVGAAAYYYVTGRGGSAGELAKNLVSKVVDDISDNNDPDQSKFKM